MTRTAPSTASPLRRLWAPAAVVVAILAVAGAAVVAVHGLLGNPVRATDAAGISTLEGTFLPYDCGHGAGCRGYVQAGGRSVFVVLPPRCPDPSPQSGISVRARRAPDLGNASYTAVACAAPE